GHTRPSAADARRTDLRLSRAGIRALQHALAADHEAVSAGGAGRGRRSMAGRAHLERTASEARDLGRMETARGTGTGKRHYRDAQLRRRADAAREIVPRR